MHALNSTCTRYRTVVEGLCLHEDFSGPSFMSTGADLTVIGQGACNLSGNPNPSPNPNPNPNPNPKPSPKPTNTNVFF